MDHPRGTKVKGKVLAAMSGGVDSSVAAYLLKEAGWEVEGAELKLWSPSPESSDAARVCKDLGIPFHLIDMREAFQKEVVDYFCAEYFKMRTPNPCVRCNKGIKFGLLMDQARKMGMDYLATGHYARIGEGPVLKKGVDPEKDQSYALFALPRDRLKSILLPMGTQTKEETRKIAERAGLHVMEKEESQDICFIPDGNYSRFISERFPKEIEAREGPIMNRDGEVLGMHQGLYKYTIGQRRGIGVAAKEPYYVLALRPEDNALIIGFKDETLKKEFEVSHANWLVLPSRDKVEAQVKIRYSTPACPAEVTIFTGDRANVRFLDPQRSVTPGQAAVFYDHEVVLGGGWIVGP